MITALASVKLYLWVALSVTCAAPGCPLERDWIFAGEFASVEACHRTAVVLNKTNQYRCIDSKGNSR